MLLQCLFCKTVSVTHECCLLAVNIFLLMQGDYSIGLEKFTPSCVCCILALIVQKDTPWEQSNTATGI